MEVDKFADVAVSPADLTGTESAVLLVLMGDDFIATANGKRYGLDDGLLATGVVAGFSEPCHLDAPIRLHSKHVRIAVDTRQPSAR
jgi:hypothetical protein